MNKNVTHTFVMWKHKHGASSTYVDKVAFTSGAGFNPWACDENKHAFYWERRSAPYYTNTIPPKHLKCACGKTRP